MNESIPQTEMEVPGALFSEILPGLFMGGTSEEQTIDFPQVLKPFTRERDFDCVVTLYAWAAPANWEVEERRFGFSDGSLQGWQIPVLHEIADWSLSKWKSGAKVLIRCQAGLNRSGLIAALVLIKNGSTPAKAISLIRARRSQQALCNGEFVDYLLSLSEKEVHL